MTDSEQRGRNGWDGKGRWRKGRRTEMQGIEGDGMRPNLGRQRAKGWGAWSKDENKPPSHYLRSFLPNLFCLSLHIPTPKASSLLSKRDCRLGSGGVCPHRYRFWLAVAGVKAYEIFEDRLPNRAKKRASIPRIHSFCQYYLSYRKILLSLRFYLRFMIPFYPRSFIS